MVARVRTVAFSGVEVVDVEAQVTITAGLPAFAVVGLPDKAVAESRERVRSALAALGLSLPSRHITVNLAPADVLKEGSHFDLPIALALLAAMDVLPEDELAGYTALGEVALDGSLTSVAGVLLAALAAAGRQSGLICPAECCSEAAWALTSVSAAWALSRMTSPSWPVRVRRPLPGERAASMNRMSPPTGVQASPVATPGTLVRIATSPSKRTGPRSFSRPSTPICTEVAVPSAISTATWRRARPISRSRLRTPASRV